MRRLLAFDLDGTLLDDDKHIPEENLRAIALAAERGWVPVPATGRLFPGIPQAVKELPLCSKEETANLIIDHIKTIR